MISLGKRLVSETLKFICWFVGFFKFLCNSQNKQFRWHPVWARGIRFGLLQVMLDIIMDADNEIYEENLLIISDAYEVAFLYFYDYRIITH